MPAGKRAARGSARKAWQVLFFVAKAVARSCRGRDGRRRRKSMRIGRLMETCTLGRRASKRPIGCWAAAAFRRLANAWNYDIINSIQVCFHVGCALSGQETAGNLEIRQLRYLLAVSRTVNFLKRRRNYLFLSSHCPSK